MTRPNLLILAAFDFSDGSEWFSEDWSKATAALSLGRAGDVLQAKPSPGAIWASRQEAPDQGNRPVRTRTVAARMEADGSFVILAGQIYHAREIAQRWGVGASGDDAQLYAALHARLGDDCDRHIVGDYAVVQWFPDVRRVRIARSPTSHAPLHVMRDGPRLVISSVPGPIFALGHRAEIDDTMLGDWLLLNMRRPRQSWYAGLHRVPSGTIETHDRSGSRNRRYWSLLDVPAVRFKRDEDYVEAVKEQFDRATEAALGGAKTPAVMLSGGLDSQAVAAFAVTKLPAGSVLRSYTSVPQPNWEGQNRDWAFGDESAHVRALCAMHPQIRPSFIDGASMRFGEKLQSSMLLSGWPIYNEMNAHWFHAALEQASTDGVDVVLTGDMGNASFSYDGHTGPPTWLVEGKWLRLCRELRATDFYGRPFWRKLLSRAVLPHLPLGLKLAIDHKLGRRTAMFDTWCPMREDYARQGGALARARADNHDLDGYEGASAREWRDDVVTGLLGGAPEIMLGYTLLYGTPLRDPTSYHPLVELCGGIADEQYLHNGVDRWLARRLLKDRAPELVWNERRMGMQSPDWPMRFSRDRDSILAELDELGRDPRMTSVFDIQRLAKSMAEWDGRDLPDRSDSDRIKSCISRGISTARFVRFVEGRNVG